MAFEEVVFYSFAVVLVLAALRVITASNPLHAALFLLLAFITCAGLWIMLAAEFLAFTLVLVYGGAVMVLFAFVVMMLHVDDIPLKHHFRQHAPLAVLIAAVIVMELVMLLLRADGGADIQPLAGEGLTRRLGEALFTTYVLPFELAGLLLLLAMVAAIALTHRPPQDRIVQNVAEQVAVRREDRLRILSMPAETDKPIEAEVTPAVGEKQDKGETC